MFGFIQFFTFQRQVILFFACVFLSVLLWVLPHVGFAWAWIPLLIVLILGIKHILIGTVNTAALQLQEGDIAGAEKLLKYTLKPSWLQFGYHGMYYFIQSTILMQKGEQKAAEALTHKVLQMNMADDFKAMAYLQLINMAALQLQRDPKNQLLLKNIKDYHQKAKKLNISTQQVKEQLQQVDMMLKGDTDMQRKMMAPGKGGMKSMMQQGFMKRGTGKRR
jgi:hypothetical protein